MSNWDPQQFRTEGQRRSTSTNILDAAEKIASNVYDINPCLPPIFSLRHLAHLVSADYQFIRKVVDRSKLDPYEVFRIRKKNSDGYRIICAPEWQLLVTQRWISQNILRYARPHTASYAFAPNKKIKDAAILHCDAKWLIKMDVRRFFESISEIAAYRVFNNLGYEPLISFEMARICTRLGSNTLARQKQRWRAKRRVQEIERYRHMRLGHLPQGAPTSPMLSNLAMIEFDSSLAQIAKKNDLVYSRYADELCFSKGDANFTRQKASKIIGQVSVEMGKVGLSPNVTKTKVSPPGSRKIVLGLLVNGTEVRLSREFRAKMRQHIHYLTHPNIGPARHAEKREFTSIEGMRNHIEGLIAFAHDIDPGFAASCRIKLKDVRWPFEGN